MTQVLITVGSFVFVANAEEDAAPQTWSEFRKLLPYKNKLIQARWSGEAAWAPMGELKLDVGFENHTSYPAPGHIIFYPGGFSETEILFPYGGVSFASRMGQLAGNHFMTVTEGLNQLHALGEKALWEGAQDILFEKIYRSQRYNGAPWHTIRPPS